MVEMHRVTNIGSFFSIVSQQIQFILIMDRFVSVCILQNQFKILIVKLICTKVYNIFFSKGAIKSLARRTMQKSVSTEGLTPFDVQRVRLLLEFVEQLEKAMYNAADGTATALLTPPKVISVYVQSLI